jgi:hypothetical protein
LAFRSVSSWSRLVLIHLEDATLQLPIWDDDEDSPCILQPSHLLYPIDLQIHLTDRHSSLPDLWYQYEAIAEPLGFFPYFISAAYSSAFCSVSFVYVYSKIEKLFRDEQARVLDIWPEHFSICSLDEAEDRTIELLDEATRKEQDEATGVSE